jgi:hypothetical protein
MQSMVEGAFGAAASGASEAPSTALRAVPLPRFAGQDEDASGREHAADLAAQSRYETLKDQKRGTS